MRRDASSQSPKARLAAIVAGIASVGGLVGLTVAGILTRLPLWAATVIVVTELLAPLLVYRMVKRNAGGN